MIKHQTTTNGNQNNLLNFVYINSSLLEAYYSTPHNRTSKNSNKKRSICNKKVLSYSDNNFLVFLANGSTVNNRTNIPIANIVVPREHF